MLGIPEPELTGRGLAEVWPAPAGAALEAEFRRARAQHTPTHLDSFHASVLKWFEVHAYPMPGDCLSLHLRDITVLKRNERALSRLASIVDSSEDAIMSADLDGVILTWNAAAERILGYTAAEAVGKNITLIVPPEMVDEEARILAKLNAGENIRHFETTRLRKDGVRLQVSLAISPIQDANGEIAAVSGILRDITARKTLDEQLRQTAKLESLGVLAGGIAHDFNNLLAGILGNASMAFDMLAPGSPVSLLLEDVIRAGERAASLTRQLLAYSGKGRYVIEPVDISTLCREIVGLVQASIPKSVELKLLLASDLPPVIADGTQLQQLVMNLVINAAEASAGRPGIVTVTTGEREIDDAYITASPLSGAGAAAGKYVLLEVRDEGSGMDAATLARIFDPFFTTKFTGRGLGLSATLGIVRAHKGLIRVDSAPGKGSTFTILLPAAVARKVERSRAEVSRDLRGTGVILLVDDEEVVRRAASFALERLGYHVIAAADGEIALKIFRKAPEKIALVILDLSMPLMSGEECLRHLKKIRPDTPVLLSSGFGEADALARTREGTTGFLQKPYTARRLAEAVKASIASKA